MATLGVAQGSKYTDQDRYQAVANYFTLGTAKAVSKVMGIPNRTIDCWVKSEWWAEVFAKVQEENSQYFDSLATQAITDGMSQVLDRIENGDEIIQSGEAYRRKMSGKDLATTVGILFDKRQISRNLPTQISAKSDTEALMALKKQFEALAGRTVDGEVVD